MAHQAYNFTDRVRQVLRRAREVALDMQHEYVGTEHLAIAVALEPDGPATAVLDALGAQRDDVIARVRGAVTPGSPGRRIGPVTFFTHGAIRFGDQALRRLHRRRSCLSRYWTW